MAISQANPHAVDVGPARVPETTSITTLLEALPSQRRVLALLGAALLEMAKDTPAAAVEAPELEALMTVKQVAAWLQTSRDVVYELVRTQRIPVALTLTDKRGLRFRPSALKAWLEGGGLEPERSAQGKGTVRARRRGVGPVSGESEP